MHKNLGADIYSSRCEERKKKRAYDVEHSCIATQCVTEYYEKMNVSAEQHCTIKFCAYLKKMSSEIIMLLKEAFRKETLGDWMIQLWHKAFVDGRESIEFELQGGVPQTVVTATNIDTITTVTEEDCHLTVQAFAEALHIPRDTESKDNESVTEDE